MTVEYAEETRKKHKWIRCRDCHGSSKVVSEYKIDTLEGAGKAQIRKCNKCGATFVYDYLIQAVSQDELNYKVDGINEFSKIM